MIDPADSSLPPLPAGFIWVQPKAVGPMTDRIAACLGDVEVGMVFERLNGGYFSQVGRHRDMQTLQTQGFHDFEPACRWVARWVELREPAIRSEVQVRLDRRRGFGQRS